MKRYFPAAVLALSLAACSSTSSVNATQAISDANIVVSGIAADYHTLLTLYPTAVPAAQQTKIAADLAAAQQGITTLSASGSDLSKATSLQGVETAINDVVGVVAGVLPGIPGVPPAILAGVDAADVLLPLIEVTVNQLQGVTTAPMAAMAHPAM